MKLVVLCVETDKEAQTDTKYIDKTIRQIYVVNNNIKIAYVYMNGKCNYDKKSVIKQIRRQYSGDFDEKHVVYCIDIDNMADADVIEQNNKIKVYCDSLNYDFVWFCRDVEEVFLHKRIDKSEKVNEAKRFSRLSDLGKATESSLSANSTTQYKSNLISVLDRFMTRKAN